MRQVITNFLTGNPENISEPVYWAMGMIYLLLLSVSLASVYSRSRGIVSLLAWGLLVIFLPVMGIALHCLRCLIVADYQFLKQFGLNPMKNKTLSEFSKI